MAKLPPYDHEHENEVMPFAETNFRNQRKKFGIKTDDRRRHIYVIGKTGMGKSCLLENMFLHDVYAGHGCCYVDPHGETAQKLLDYIPSERINDVVYFNPADVDHPIGFNIFELKHENQKHLVANGLMAVFKKIWEGVWSSRMEYILLNTVLALMDAPGSTLLGINRMLSDEEYRRRVVSLIQDPVVKTFWVKEFAAFSEKYRTEAVAPVQNKVGQFLSASIIRNIVAQVKSTMNLREIMDNRKILILNLSKGLIGEENSRLLGAMVITRLQLAAMERVDMPEEDRQDFYLYVDEFQNFATEAFAHILSEARKYRLSLTVAHQYIEQLDETVQAAIFGNVGTLISFRVGAPDATELVKEFTPRFTEEDLVNLTKYQIYLRLMIDGAASEPFSANTLPPIAQRTGSTDKVIKVSRERYSTPKEKIEEKVLKWSGMGTVDVGGKIITEEEQEAAETAQETAEEAAKAQVVEMRTDEGSDLTDEEREIEEKIKALQASSPDIPGLPEKPKKKPKKTYQIPCSVCGEIQTLNFEPDWSRPWFCKQHLEEKQAGTLKAPPRRPSGPPPPASKMAASAPPPSGTAEPVAKPAPSGSVSLSALSSGAGTVPTERPVDDRVGRTSRPDRRNRRDDRRKPKGQRRPDRRDDRRPPPARPPISQAEPVTRSTTETVSLSALAANPTPEKPAEDRGERAGADRDDRKSDQPAPKGRSGQPKAEPDNPPESGGSGGPLKPGQVIKF